jgi:guanyl-specific ribonuclease Sa
MGSINNNPNMMDSFSNCGFGQDAMQYQLAIGSYTQDQNMKAQIDQSSSFGSNPKKEPLKVDINNAHQKNCIKQENDTENENHNSDRMLGGGFKYIKDGVSFSLWL